MLFLYPIFIFICFIFLLYFLTLILIHIYKKKNFSFDTTYYKTKNSLNLYEIIKLLFYYQPAYIGCCLAYSFYHYLMLNNKIKVNILNLIVQFVLRFIVGFSYTFLSIIKSLLIIIFETINDEELLYKNKKYFIIYRLLLHRLHYIAVIEYSEYRNKVKNMRIIIKNIIIFNPPKFLKNIRSTSDLLTHKSGKIEHLSVVKDNKYNEANVLTTHPLKDQQCIGIYGKINSKISYNNISPKKVLSTDISKKSIIIEKSGLDNIEFRNQILNEINFIRQSDTNGGTIIHHAGNDGRVYKTESIPGSHISNLINYYGQDKSIKNTEYYENLFQLGEAHSEINKDTPKFKQVSAAREKFKIESYERSGKTFLGFTPNTSHFQNTEKYKEKGEEKIIKSSSINEIQIKTKKEHIELILHNTNTINNNIDKPLLISNINKITDNDRPSSPYNPFID